MPNRENGSSKVANVTVLYIGKMIDENMTTNFFCFGYNNEKGTMQF